MGNGSTHRQLAERELRPEFIMIEKTPRELRERIPLSAYEKVPAFRFCLLSFLVYTTYLKEISKGYSVSDLLDIIRIEEKPVDQNMLRDDLLFLKRIGAVDDYVERAGSDGGRTFYRATPLGMRRLEEYGMTPYTLHLIASR